MERQVKRQKREDGAPLATIGAALPEVQAAILPSLPDDCDSGRSFRLTRLKDAPPSHNERAVSVRDLFQGDFSSCLLTNYKVDLAWLIGECPRLTSVPVVLVHGERDRHSLEQQCAALANVTPVSPPLPIPYGTHHTKMVAVMYPSKVRISIFTANFVASDWDYKTQGVWWQDFGLKTLSDSSDEDEEEAKPSPANGPVLRPKMKLPDFEEDLIGYLSSLGKPVATFCRELRRFDFSTARVALVPSIPGVHRGKDMDKYGHLRVRRLLRDLHVPPTDHPLICQFSSLGSLDEKWLFGEFADSFLPGRTDVSPSSTPVQALHLIWPSVNDVRNSNEGWSAGRSVPCPLKNMKPFLHKYLRKWSPPSSLHRQHAMPHIKTYARFDPRSSDANTLDWALLTSSNLSKAAWGSLQKNQSQFMIRSYELGVLFLPSLLSVSQDRSQGRTVRLGVVGSVPATAQDDRLLLLPMPYAFPLSTYNPTKDEPWVWDLVREDPDVFGDSYMPS